MNNESRSGTNWIQKKDFFPKKEESFRVSFIANLSDLIQTHYYILYLPLEMFVQILREINLTVVIQTIVGPAFSRRWFTNVCAILREIH